MNEQLASDLKAAFSRHASALPTGAGAGLRQVDYHPRTSRVPARLTAGALAGAAVTTGTVVSAVVLGSSQAAFAGWSAAPTAASAARTSTAEATCAARLAAVPAPPGGATPGPWSTVDSDVRGPFTLVVYGDGGGDVATCITGPSITVVSLSAAHGGSVTASGQGGAVDGRGASGSTMITRIGSGSITKGSVTHLDSTSQGPYTLVEGQLDPSVTGVTLIRSDGEHVEASTANGWFVAWWPGNGDTTSAEITTAAGVTTQTLTTPPALPPTGVKAAGVTSTGPVTGPPASPG